MDEKAYYQGLKNIIMRQFNGDATWSDVVEYREQNGVKTTYDYVQRGSAILMELLRAGYTITPPADAELDTALHKEDVYNSDGTHTYSKLIEISELEEVTPELIMEKHGLDQNQWECVSYKNNAWTTGSKTISGKPVANYQSKITVKPKHKNEVTFEDIEEYFKNKNFKAKPSREPIVIDDRDEYLHIDIADPHFGLYAWGEEVGKGCDYDIHIATERFLDAFRDIIGRCKGKKYKCINLVTLGDILHVDNMAGTTTKGTAQDTDGRITKIFNAVADLMCDAIDMLLELSSPVKYTYIRGNHDSCSGNFLCKCLEMVYRNDSRVSFDISPNPQKAIVYGNTLVGLTHGDMKKKNLAEWLQRDFRKEFGQCKFAEVHCGHLHEHSVEQVAGVTIRRVPTICESSLWEHTEGYGSQKAVMCYVYHETLGLRETWNTYIK